jgi:hypothetical protein
MSLCSASFKLNAQTPNEEKDRHITLNLSFIVIPCVILCMLTEKILFIIQAIELKQHNP